MYLRQVPFIETITNHVLQLDLNCCISAPTGKLASTYAKDFPACRVNTVHSNYFIPVDKTNKNNGINWGLADIHVLLVDEVIFYFIKSLYIPTK